MTLHINDSNYQDHIESAGPTDDDGNPRMFGLIPRDYEKVPYGSTGFATPVGLPLIPMEEWPDRIADQERTKSSLWHIWRDSMGSKILDQNGIPYCHAFSPALAIMILRAVNNLAPVEISAGSIGGPVTGYRKRGAWIMDDLKQVVRHGAATTEFVPMLQVSRSGWKPGADENARRHKVEEWWEGRRRSQAELMTCLLSNIPVCTGHNWWGHAVTAIRAIDVNPNLSATNWKRYGSGNLNSWGANYGDRGYFILSGSKHLPDEQYMPRVTTASA